MKERIIGPFLFLMLKDREREREKGEENGQLKGIECIFSQCSDRETMFINELVVVSIFLLIFIVRQQIHSLILPPFYWNQTTFR
jgi:hypothetical protein